MVISLERSAAFAVVFLLALVLLVISVCERLVVELLLDKAEHCR